MKKIITSLAVLILAASAVLAGTPQKAAKATFKVDTKDSKLKWVGKKVTGEHTGYVSFKSGEIALNNNVLTSANVQVDMATITCSDIENADYNANLVGHLKSADFFSVEKHSTASFAMDKVTPITGAKEGENNYKLSGKLTIKGVSNNIEFPAKVEIKEKVIVVRADVSFDRTKYDMKFKSASVFSDLGDKAILDDVQFSFALVGRAQ